MVERFNKTHYDLATVILNYSRALVEVRVRTHYTVTSIILFQPFQKKIPVFTIKLDSIFSPNVMYSTLSKPAVWTMNKYLP